MVLEFLVMCGSVEFYDDVWWFVCGIVGFCGVFEIDVVLCFEFLIWY